MMDPAQKAAHEAFLTDAANEGVTHPWEIAFISVCSVLMPILNWGMVKQIFNIGKEKDSWDSMLYEFLLLTVPQIACLTLLTGWPLCLLPLLVLLLCCTVFGLFLTSPKTHQEVTSFRGNNTVKPVTRWISSRLAEKKITSNRNFPFVTNYRASMLLTTAICILAVDFKVFPRHFSKTEVAGFGLMDIGVGSFVFAAGLMSQEARRPGSLSTLAKSLKETVPMLALGFVRLLSIKGSGYQEHLSEYGVHWNFFFSLAASKFVASLAFLVLPSSNWKYPWGAALITGLLNESVLHNYLGLRDWALTPEDVAPRDISLVYANREGLVSVVGFVALYFAGVAMGSRLRVMEGSFMGQLKETIMMAVLGCCMWLSLYFSPINDTFTLPSRRVANWSYFNWMCAYNISLLALFMAVDLTIIYTAEEFAKSKRLAAKVKSGNKPRRSGPGSSSSSTPARPSKTISSDDTTCDPNALPHIGIRVPVALAAISFNGLVYFLLANVLTGVVNLSTDTLTWSECPAVCVICAYALVTQVGAVRAYSRRWSFKFW